MKPDYIKIVDMAEKAGQVCATFSIPEDIELVQNGEITIDEFFSRSCIFTLR